MRYAWLTKSSSIIVAIISLIGMVVVALIQSSKASNSQVESIVQGINSNVIPAIQTELDKHETDMDKLREEVAYLRGATQHKGTTRTVGNTKGTVVFKAEDGKTGKEAGADKTLKERARRLPSLPSFKRD